MNHLSGRKIGILGGSFDPVHNGHLAIARAAYTDFDLDEVWFIPAGHSPNKNESGMTLPEYRAEMVALAVKPYPYFKMSTVEIEAERDKLHLSDTHKIKEPLPGYDILFYHGCRFSRLL